MSKHKNKNKDAKQENKKEGRGEEDSDTRKNTQKKNRKRKRKHIHVNKFEKQASRNKGKGDVEEEIVRLPLVGKRGDIFRIGYQETLDGAVLTLLEEVKITSSGTATGKFQKRVI